MKKQQQSKKQSAKKQQPPPAAESNATGQQEAIVKLTKDLGSAVSTMTRDEARFLVDAYYQMQDNRMRFNGQIRSVKEEPHAVLSWMSGNATFLEEQIKTALKYYAESQHMGRWAMTVTGIGPIVAAGLLAHIDMRPWECAHTDNKEKRCNPNEPHGPECKRGMVQTAGQIWRFAGMDPTSKWEKGKVRPWNPEMKRLCYIIGESFVKVKAHPDSFYSRVFVERKALEWQRNLDGKLAEAARAALEQKDFGRDTGARKWYSGQVDPKWARKIVESGESFPITPKLLPGGAEPFPMLPPAHIHRRATRYAAKLFLSHWFEEAYRMEFGKEPPLPYPIAHMGHAHVKKPK